MKKVLLVFSIFLGAMLVTSCIYVAVPVGDYPPGEGYYDEDYYGHSASLSGIGATFPYHPDKPSPVHMPDSNVWGEVADRNLCPCFPQVDTDTPVWLCSPRGVPWVAIHIQPPSSLRSLHMT